MRVLLTGGSSLLGWAFLKQAPAEWEIVVALHHNQDLPSSCRPARIAALDITRRDQVKELFERVRPEVVVHLSSIGSLDYCKEHPEEKIIQSIGYVLQEMRKANGINPQ